MKKPNWQRNTKEIILVNTIIAPTTVYGLGMENWVEPRIGND